MNRRVFSMIFLALVAHLCVAEIVIKTSEPEHLTHLYDAAIDILITCYRDPGNGIGIVGDSDGAFLKALRIKYFIPVVLTNNMIASSPPDSSTQYELQVFVVAAPSAVEAFDSMFKLSTTKWWNLYAKFLFIDATPNYNRQCADVSHYMYLLFYYGVLDAQFICYQGSSGVSIFNCNLFTPQAPPVWKLVTVVKWPNVGARMMGVFYREYRKGGQACEALNFPKTSDIGGWPLYFLATEFDILLNNDNAETQKYLKSLPIHVRRLLRARHSEARWVMDNIASGLNATSVMSTYPEFYNDSSRKVIGVSFHHTILSLILGNVKVPDLIPSQMIFPMYDEHLFAVTKYTGHMSQLDKILSVVDRTSRIGMWVVYLITFLFFKFFLDQAVVPALLNLVRLTCNVGLLKLPQNLAPTIYLSCLLMFVVTMQGIYTGNLATLLTTTIAYRNVETKQDIPDLGYTVCIEKNYKNKVVADPILDGHLIELPNWEKCMDYLLKEPLATSVRPNKESVFYAVRLNLHISTDPIVQEHIFYFTTQYNPLARRLESQMRRWTEQGLWYVDPDIEKLRLLYLYDDEVKKNTVRRVMNLTDLCFAFVILGIGLMCSLICFIGEIAVYKIRLKIAKRRNRVRARLAWGVKKNSFLSFPSFNFRFNVRRLFSKRR